MGLSRRTFTREFKLAAVRRLEAGVSLAEGGNFEDEQVEGALQEVGFFERGH
jgi:hypothetical protein